MSNTKEKMKHLPINLFFSLDFFGFSFAAFSIIQENNYFSFFMALIIYLNSAITKSQIDYLDEQIKTLKGENNLS